MEDLRRVTFPQAQKPPNELRQLPIKRTTRKKLKALQSNVFNFSLGLGLSEKRGRTAIKGAKQCQ